MSFDLGGRFNNVISKLLSNHNDELVNGWNFLDSVIQEVMVSSILLLLFTI